MYGSAYSTYIETSSTPGGDAGRDKPRQSWCRLLQPRKLGISIGIFHSAAIDLDDADRWLRRSRLLCLLRDEKELCPLSQPPDQNT